jgi:formamidopyrimidine-DNA glycosylase
MKWVLRRAIALNADLEGHDDVFLIPHRVKGGDCPHGHPLASRTIGGRTSYFCTVEQK